MKRAYMTRPSTFIHIRDFFPRLSIASVDGKQRLSEVVGLLQRGLFIFRRWDNYSIVQFIVCWSGSEGPPSLGPRISFR